MVKDAEARGPCITGNRDPRITRVGSVLRRTKLDELPQVLNLLLGDMTLVGPRPEAPAMVSLYTPAQREVLSVKPGVTGPGQLSYEREESDGMPEGGDAVEFYVEHLLEPKLQADLEYIGKRSPASDLRIVLKTAGRILGIRAGGGGD
jgi:lipopolysaccharide/colanic/teichoic acid biosynthesis glycosyltransferase